MANILFHWLMAGWLSLMHPFYVSVIELNHNPRAASVEISIRAFAEDMEKVLQKYSTRRIDILHPSDNTFLESQISSYINQKLHLKVNGEPATMKYLGHEIEKESVWIYLEVPKTPTLGLLEIDCKFLYDLVPNQTNLIHAKAGGVDKNYKLDYPDNIVKFGF